MSFQQDLDVEFTIYIVQEGIAVGRSFAMYKNYNIDANKEMIAMGTYEHSWFFHLLLHHNRNSNVSIIVDNSSDVDIAIPNTLVPLHSSGGAVSHYCICNAWPQIMKQSSISGRLINLICCNFCTSGLFIARPRTFVLGNIPNFRIYRNVEQYPNAKHVPGILILDIDAPVYFANASYLRERITRWVDEEESRIKATGKTSLQYVIMDMSGVGKIYTSGTSMLEEVQKITQRRELQAPWFLENPVTATRPPAQLLGTHSLLPITHYAQVVGGRAFFLLAAAVVEDTQLVAPPGLAGLPPVSTGIRWCGLPSVSVRQWWR
ncbi:Sulfate transporter 3.1 [Vigna angularis]|uniref:Sulfate transporter 3.1 n=1 Tax=Phaseolus angularis TaxID=3914 RepID=A0A8T0KSN4_PHAAN|nr:Sulfate transporter 3.1 [Vigna angularis]